VEPGFVIDRSHHKPRGQLWIGIGLILVTVAGCVGLWWFA
jgi:hypothetical protein